MPAGKIRFFFLFFRPRRPFGGGKEIFRRRKPKAERRPAGLVSAQKRQALARQTDNSPDLIKISIPSSTMLVPRMASTIPISLWMATIMFSPRIFISEPLQ